MLAHESGAQESSVIIVNERALVGPNSASQLRGGRLFLPIAAIAQALGDTLNSDSTTRTVTIRRQNGTVAVFNAQLNEVRENGSVVLTVSGTADLIFPPTPNELMLPAEIVAALLDVIVRRDENNAIVISRKGIQVETVRAGAKRAPWELFQIEYDYNFSRYASTGDHSLVLRGTGRVGDAKLSFIANSSIGVSNNSSRPASTWRKCQAGSCKRAELRCRRIRYRHGRGIHGGCRTRRDGPIAFGSRATRFFRRANNFGIVVDSAARSHCLNPQSTLLPVRYDTKIFGAIATTDSLARHRSDFTFSGGAMHFGGPSRKGNLVAGGFKYTSGVNRFQADVAMGQFDGVSTDKIQRTGAGVAINLAGSYRLTEDLLVQGRYAYVGPTFLSPQSGLHTPNNMAAAGVSWQPRGWLTTTVSGEYGDDTGKGRTV